MRDDSVFEHSDVIVAQPTKRDLSSNRGLLNAAKDSGILFFGQLFDYASRFVFGLILARAIGAEGYGLYSLGLSTALTLVGLAELGMPMAVMRFLPHALRERDETRVWGIIQVAVAFAGVFGLAAALIVFGFSDFWAEKAFRAPEMAPVLRWISICIPLTTVGRVLMAVFRGFQRTEYQIYANNIAFNAVKIGLTVLLLGIGLGVRGALAAHVLAWVIEIGLLFYYLDRLFPLRRPQRVDRRTVREMGSFSLPIGLTHFVQQSGSELELLLLGMMGTMSAVGIYSVARRILLVGTMFLRATQKSAMPLISDLYHQGETKQLARLYQTLSRWSLSFVLPFSLTVFLFASPLLSIFGKDFEAGSLALVFVTLGMLTNAGTGICSPMITMSGRSKLAFLNSVVFLILNTVLNLTFIPIWGLVGAAIATALAAAVVNGMRLLQVYWLFKLLPYNRAFVKPVIAAAVALTIGFIVSRFIPAEANLFHLALNVAALWSSYAAVILLLGLSDEDRMVLTRMKRRFGTKLVQRRVPTK